MRGTLSHPVPRPGRPSRRLFPRRLARGVGSSIAGLFLVALAGCQDDAPTTANAGGVRKIESATSAAKSDAFEWPADPSHPVLELQIASPDRQGTILIELMPELAPSTVVRILDLAGEGFYDGTTFHRVIPGFMIQGGDPKSRDRDPTNDGTGGMLRDLPDEFGDVPFVRGVVGLGNRGRENSNSAQFFIMQADNRNLDGRYNAIGRVLQGMQLVDDITQAPIDRTGRWGPKDRPVENIVIESVTPVGQVAAIRSAIELEGGSVAFEATNGKPTPETPNGDALDTPSQARAEARPRAATPVRATGTPSAPAAAGPAALAP